MEQKQLETILTHLECYKKECFDVKNQVDRTLEESIQYLQKQIKKEELKLIDPLKLMDKDGSFEIDINGYRIIFDTYHRAANNWYYYFANGKKSYSYNSLWKGQTFKTLEKCVEDANRLLKEIA